MTQDARVSSRSKHTPFFSSGESYQDLSEAELSDWAEQTAIASSGQGNVSRLGVLIFWTVIALVLIVRFFVIDPKELRPQSGISSSSISTMMH